MRRRARRWLLRRERRPPGPTPGTSPRRARSSSTDSFSARVVKDDPQRGAGAARDRAHAVAQADAVVAVGSEVRPLPGGKDHERALRGLEDVSTALRARTLLH